MKYVGSVSLWTLYVDTLFGESVTANTDILATDILLDDTVREKKFVKVASYTFEGAFSSQGVLEFVITRISDGTEKVVKVNGGTAIGADCGFTFNLTLTEGYSVNLRYSASCTLNWLTITGHGGKI